MNNQADNFIKEITPQLMLDRWSELVTQQPELLTLSYILTPEQLLVWLNTIGMASYNELPDHITPIPPYSLRSKVAEGAESVFLWTGLTDTEICLNYLDRHFAPTEGEKISTLDFGCGCGRLTRIFGDLPRIEMYGTDVNEDLVRWCVDNLERVKTTTNGVKPPLPCDESQFDFIFSLSIFTHLPEASMLSWLNELARVTADNGILLLTTHGYTALDIIRNSDQHQEMFFLTSEQVDSLRNNISTTGFFYNPYPASTIEFANAGEDYGNCFIHESYIRENWTCGGAFDVVEFVPGGLRGWQDITILKRAPR